jgi:hypothetical protein
MSNHITHVELLSNTYDRLYGEKNEKMPRRNMMIIYLLFLPIITPLFTAMNVMAVTEHEGFGQLRYVGSNAFGDISRMVETDCGNGIDDDGDGLTDMEDIEDCA